MRFHTKFKPLLLPTQAGIPYTHTHKHRTSYFKSTLTFLGPAMRWKSISSKRQNREILVVLHHNNNNFNQDLFYFSSDKIPPRSVNKYSQNLYQSVVIHLKCVLLVLLLRLLKYLGL